MAVIVIFKELSRAKVLMKPGKVSSSLLQELRGKQKEKGELALIWICLARL